MSKGWADVHTHTHTSVQLWAMTYHFPVHNDPLVGECVCRCLPQCLIKVGIFCLFQQVPTTAVSRTATHPTLPTVKPGGSPTPVYWVSTQRPEVLFSKLNIVFRRTRNKITKIVKTCLQHLRCGFNKKNLKTTNLRTFWLTLVEFCALVQLKKHNFLYLLIWAFIKCCLE